VGASDEGKYAHLTHPELQNTFKLDPIHLFRYSALTFNSHLIHYDLNYAVNEGNLPGILVHGPLTATLLLSLLRNSSLKSYEYRAISPIPLKNGSAHVTVNAKKAVNGGEWILWATSGGNSPAMVGTATT